MVRWNQYVSYPSNLKLPNQTVTPFAMKGVTFSRATNIINLLLTSEFQILAGNYAIGFTRKLAMEYTFRFCIPFKFSTLDVYPYLARN